MICGLFRAHYRNAAWFSVDCATPCRITRFTGWITAVLPLTHTHLQFPYACTLYIPDAFGSLYRFIAAPCGWFRLVAFAFRFSSHALVLPVLPAHTRGLFPWIVLPSLVADYAPWITAHTLWITFVPCLDCTPGSFGRFAQFLTHRFCALLLGFPFGLPFAHSLPSVCAVVPHPLVNTRGLRAHPPSRAPTTHAVPWLPHPCRLPRATLQITVCSPRTRFAARLCLPHVRSRSADCCLDFGCRLI